jgi:hypothetical protein
MSHLPFFFKWPIFLPGAVSRKRKRFVAVGDRGLVMQPRDRPRGNRKSGDVPAAAALHGRGSIGIGLRQPVRVRALEQLLR